MLRFIGGAAALILLATPALAVPHNVILFVADGLRGGIVRPDTAPAAAALRAEGVAFPNSHSLFPTFTTANASALATGHMLGDTGDFSNTIYTAVPIITAGSSVTPFLEQDAVLGELDARFGHNYLNEATVLEAARAAGIGTVAIGKLGPALIQDHRARDGTSTIILDDATGSATGIPLAAPVAAAFRAAGLPLAAPGRGENGKSGSATAAGTLAPNVSQQAWFVDAATKAILPMLKLRGRPFVMVFWSRDPDGSQHNQGDSFQTLEPGINGPTSLAGIRNADDNLARIRRAVEELGLTSTTDIIVTSDHGFSTISKESETSPSRLAAYGDVRTGTLPPGFVALDLAKALGLPLFDPAARNAPIAPGTHPSTGSAILGPAPDTPEVVVAANGGSDLIYLPTRDRALARRIVTALFEQDYVSGVFVDDDLGPIAGTLPLSAVGLKGHAVTPTPAIVLNFRSEGGSCALSTNCMIEVADSVLQQGQGMHGSFGRGDTFNFTAAVGPDFRAGFVDPMPVSNADVGLTIMRLLGLRVPARGGLLGRNINEALVGGRPRRVIIGTRKSAPGPGGLRTTIRYQNVGRVRYYDAGGFVGRTLGINSAPRDR